MKFFLSKWQSRLFRMSEQETIVSIMCRNIHLPSGSGSDTSEKKLEEIRWRRTKWKKRELEVQEDIYVIDDSVLKIREIKILKALKCNRWVKP